jgi:hypothetical protein
MIPPPLLDARFGYLVGGDYFNNLRLNYLNSVWSTAFPDGSNYDEDADRMLACAKQAMKEVQDSLFSLYDFYEEYTLTGSQRNPTIVRLVGTIAAYLLAKRDDSLSKDLMNSYNQAIKDIQDYKNQTSSIAGMPAAPNSYRSIPKLFDSTWKYVH